MPIIPFQPRLNRYGRDAAQREQVRDPVVRAWHDKKRARDGGIGLRSVVAIMRKLAKALWHMARGQRFDAAKLFDTRLLDIPADPMGPVCQ